ncbi:hypothetical protein Efla_001716 [Eimeria flavescens]
MPLTRGLQCLLRGLTPQGQKGRLPVGCCLVAANGRLHRSDTRGLGDDASHKEAQATVAPRRTGRSQRGKQARTQETPAFTDMVASRVLEGPATAFASPDEAASSRHHSFKEGSAPHSSCPVGLMMLCLESVELLCWLLVDGRLAVWRRVPGEEGSRTAVFVTLEGELVTKVSLPLRDATCVALYGAQACGKLGLQLPRGWCVKTLSPRPQAKREG